MCRASVHLSNERYAVGYKQGQLTLARVHMQIAQPRHQNPPASLNEARVGRQRWWIDCSDSSVTDENGFTLSEPR